VTLVQADLCSLPFRDETFHRVVSCQVLEHVPGEAAREQAVEQLSRVLRQGGKLCLSAYQYGPFTRGFGPKEGEHAGGIYYFRFRREELRSLLSRAFRVERMTGALLYHYIAQCRKETLSVG
jgi:SAM-dependent methyltransferase